MKLELLDKFKKQNTVQYVSWTKSSLKADGIWYKIKNINIDGKNYPYVCVPDNIKKPKTLKNRKLELPKETLDKIRKINKEKVKLKDVSFLVNNNEYFIIGIGKKSIKAIKNEKKIDYFWYNTKEGESLLNHLYGKIGQSSLQIIE